MSTPTGPPRTGGSYAGHPDTFIIDMSRHASERGRVYQLNGRPCEVWERPVLDRAYDRLAAWDAQTVTVANR